MSQIPITLTPTSGSGSGATVGKPPVVVGTDLFEMLRGPQGLPGTPGSAGGSSFTHTQSIALAVWTIPHNLGRYPSINVTDTLGRLIVPDVTYVDSNTVQVTHGVPLSGFAYCN